MCESGRARKRKVPRLLGAECQKERENMLDLSLIAKCGDPSKARPVPVAQDATKLCRTNMSEVKGTTRLDGRTLCLGGICGIP